MAQLVLLPGKDRSLARRHPWIFAAAVERLSGRVRPGDTVEVLAANGRPLAKAAWSPQSKIRARVWTFDPEEIVDNAFFKRCMMLPMNSAITDEEVDYIAKAIRGFYGK